jgi:hypothetical protein
MTTILIKKKDTAGAPASGDLTNAAGGTEIAVNTATKRIYSKDSGGNVIELGTNPSGTTMAGNLLFSPDNTYDIGASGATRARTLYLGTSLITPAITNTGLTSGRVVYSTTGGLETDSANLTFDGTNLTLLGGTANGVAYLNGSKVLTTGSALTFNGTTFTAPQFYQIQNLASAYNTQVLENTASNGYTQFNFYIGASGANGIAGINYAPGIFYSFGILANDTTTPLTFRANNATEYMRIAVAAGGIGAVGIGYTALTNVGNNGLAVLGNVGIGTSSPLGRLMAVEGSRANSTNIGNVNVYTNSTAAIDLGGTIALGGTFDTANSANFAPFGSIRGAKENATNNNYAGYLQFNTIAAGGVLTEKMRIDSSGNVGIGTSSPVAIFGKTLQIASGTTEGSLSIVGSTGNGFVATVGSAFTINGRGGMALTLGTNDTEKVRIDTSGNVLVTSAAGLGYGTGSGGTVTQATSKSTGVTLNKPTGQITMNNAALLPTTSVVFLLSNSLLAATDSLIVQPNYGANSQSYTAQVTFSGAGGAYIRVTNESGGSLSEAVTLSFAIIKGATS